LNSFLPRDAMLYSAICAVCPSQADIVPKRRNV